MIPGRRLADHFDEQPGFTWDMVKPGDYFRLRNGHWCLVAPSGEHGGANDRTWKITEHEDGTITVSPSLWFNRRQNGWHGFLERGQWRQV